MSDNVLATDPAAATQLVTGLQDLARGISTGCVADPGGDPVFGPAAAALAAARGVPVVGTPLGVLPSLVEHGRTGFLAAAEDDLVEHLRDLDSIDPQTCRDAAEQWTPAGMARRYLDLYHRLLEENPT